MARGHRLRNQLEKKKKKIELKTSSASFWNKEYQKGNYLALSMNASSDMIKFVEWLSKHGIELNEETRVFDLGSGNGRNLVYLAEQYQMHGVGYDISVEAVNQARKHSKVNKDIQDPTKLVYEARSIAGRFENIPDNSQNIVLDMMVSHFLTNAERAVLQDEVLRVLKPGGWYYYKTFLLDGDRNAQRMIKENPGPEENSYVHPSIGVVEYVFTEKIIRDELGYFTIHRATRSHKHLGKAAKRRSISVYAQKL